MAIRIRKFASSILSVRIVKTRSYSVLRLEKGANMNRLIKHSLTVSLAAHLLVSFPTYAQLEVIVSNDNNALGVKGKTFQVLRNELERELGNSVRVRLFHDSTLLDQKAQIQGLQQGRAHIIAPTSGVYAAVSPAVNALTLPFLLSTPAQIEKALKDPLIRKAFASKLEANNIVPIAAWMNGPRDLAYKGQKPILVPNDMIGVKIRVQPVPPDMAAMKAVGASASSLSWSEVPSALKVGLIDAVEPTPNALVGAGLVGIIDQVTRLGYQYSFYIVGANKHWLESMSTSEKHAFQKALDVATRWNWENTEKENAAAYAQVKASGKAVNDISQEQRKIWAKSMKSVWMTFGEMEVGVDVMNRLMEIGQVK